MPSGSTSGILDAARSIIIKSIIIKISIKMNARRKRDLARLERQGLTYDAQLEFFDCKYCPNGISSPHVADGNRHVQTEKHRRF